ncbi:hypothetical protein TraAM80_05664 [Trypanosoma rangeli]|uniref:Uncharacterized protein n=1 Tax=Trypanosoma rangeli TaxID=5698 RepID=A0A422NE06_TRYRA|nr:uncharacterized protein TraAM80_05664 [Trypanosoma rangeli]RNF03622.1 hypothetical protein TraAM80_05664 [Trypanosoma rangeli]|eukprot:RNF03622.1 hypothetical protein TraAM80_05664 [Trypanosoma rangeli]
MDAAVEHFLGICKMILWMSAKEGDEAGGGADSEACWRKEEEKVTSAGGGRVVCCGSRSFAVASTGLHGDDGFCLPVRLYNNWFARMFTGRRGAARSRGCTAVTRAVGGAAATFFKRGGVRRSATRMAGCVA